MKDNKSQLSYDDGLKDGYNKGLGEGQNKGYEKGYRIGMDIGSNKGYKEGFEYGFEKGYREGHNLGYNMGFLAGLKEKDIRYHQGYEIGYKKGFDSAFHKLSNFTGRIVDCGDVLSLIKNAYIEEKGLSIIRLGHTDILKLENRNDEGREFVLRAFQKASIIGIPTCQISQYQLYLLDILEKEGVKLQDLIITDADINYALMVYNFISLLINEKIKTGIILNQGDKSIKNLQKPGLNIIGEVFLGEGQLDSIEELDCIKECNLILNFSGKKGTKFLWNNNWCDKLIILDLGDTAGCLMEKLNDV